MWIFLVLEVRGQVGARWSRDKSSCYRRYLISSRDHGRFRLLAVDQWNPNCNWNVRGIRGNNHWVDEYREKRISNVTVNIETLESQVICNTFYERFIFARCQVGEMRINGWFAMALNTVAKGLLNIQNINKNKSTYGQAWSSRTCCIIHNK